MYLCERAYFAMFVDLNHACVALILMRSTRLLGSWGIILKFAHAGVCIFLGLSG